MIKGERLGQEKILIYKGRSNASTSGLEGELDPYRSRQGMDDGMCNHEHEDKHCMLRVE